MLKKTHTHIHIYLVATPRFCPGGSIKNINYTKKKKTIKMLQLPSSYFEIVAG